MRREGTDAGQNVLLACASAPGSIFEFTFRHPLRKYNTFPPLPAHSKVLSNDIPINNLIHSQRTFNKVFDTLNKENKTAPFVFGAPQPPQFSFSLLPPKQDSVKSNTNTAVLTQQSNNITNKSAEYRPSSQNSLLTSFIPDNTRHFSTKTLLSERQSNIPKPAPAHYVNEVMFSIASANTFFKETHPIITSPIKSSDDFLKRQMSLATDDEIATNILENKADVVCYTTTLYAGNKRKERDSDDDISDSNMSKRRRRNWERPQNLLYASNISLNATLQTAATQKTAAKSVSPSQLKKEDDLLINQQIIASRSYDQEDLDALLVAQNSTTMMNQPATPQKLKESSVVVIRSIKAVDDLFEELNNDAKTIAGVKRSNECDADNGSELIYVHRDRRVKSGVKITEIPWAAGDSSDEDEIQVLRSMPRVLFSKPPINAPRLDPNDFDSYAHASHYPQSLGSDNRETWLHCLSCEFGVWQLPKPVLEQFVHGSDILFNPPQMSKRFQNTNKFRNVVGKVAKRENWFSELQISTSSLSDNANLIQANRKWLAVKWNGSGGTLALLPADKPGKLASAENVSLLHAHGAGLTDWSFSEFDQQVIATGAEDGTVKVWRVPEDGIGGDAQATCTSTMNVQAPRTNSVKFHPTADNLITTLGSNRKEIMVWDVGNEKEALKVEAEAPLHSFAWKGDGSLIATTGKDIVQVWDPRQSKEATQTGKGHEGIKGSRSMWLGSGNFLMTTGLNKMRYRQYGIWDARNLEKPIKMSSFDSSTGQLIPLYDEDTETMYFVGRGDSTIRSFQLSNLGTEPTISENMACGTNNSLFGACLLPKLSLNVMSAEIARIMTVTNNAVVPVSFEVPRKQYLDFHVELFPDTKGSEPALSAERWLAGENATVNTVSMDPSSRQNQTVNKKLESPSKQPTQEKAVGANTTMKDSKPLEVAKEAGLTNKSVSSTELSSNDNVPAKEEKSSSEITDSSDQQTPEGNVATKESPKVSSDNSTTSDVKPVAKKLPKYGGTNVSPYKYILGKPYHPSKHYVDLRGLSNDKSGATELIQANSKFIAVPISGPGGRVGIIATAKPGRLPTKIPCVLCGSSVVDFKFDPFDPNVLVTASEDDKLRIWQIPDEGITEDVSEPSHVLSSNSMDKIVTVAFNPVAKDVLLTVSADRNNCGIRLWDLASKEEKRHLPHGDIVFDAAWKSDGKQFATISKSKKLKVFDANNFDLIAEGPGHNSVRPAKLTWLGETNMIASIGFGLGSSREVLVYKVDDLAKGPSFKKTIDESPSAMSAHYDPDCGVLYVAGKGDRIIHTFEVEENSLTPLAKYESDNQQQGIAFLPKRYCDVREIEIGKFYRLTANSIVTTGMKVRRARPEFFEDSIFCPTLDVETAAQDSKSWFNGESKEMRYISLQPDDMTPLSEAPPLPQTEAKKRFAIGKKEVSDDEKRKELMQKMFDSAKDVEEKAELNKAAPVEDEEKEVADDEWDD